MAEEKTANVLPKKKRGSALKRMRVNETNRLKNRYQAKTSRTFIKRLRKAESKEEALSLFKQVSSMLDKLAKKGVIHKNKASNNKARLAKHINSLK